MELRHLRYFLAVADEGSVTRAAERLHISQPPLSLQIKELERLVGVPLFERSAQGMRLTPAGQAFRTEAEHTLHAAQGARQAALRAAQGHTGTLRVGYTTSAVFHPAVTGALQAFRRAWPEVQVHLEESNTTRLSEALRAGTLDAAFLRPDGAEPAELRLHRFKDEAMKVVLPASHRLAAQRRIALRHLAEDPFVLFPRSVGPGLHDAVVHACRAAGFEPLRGPETLQLSSVINLVAAGMGVSLVPDSLTQIQLPGVRYLGIQGAAPKAALALAWPRAGTLPTVQNLVQITLTPPHDRPRP